MAEEKEKLIVDAPSELTVKYVHNFYTYLMESVDSYSGVLLNLIGVVEMDTAGFQLLVALKKEIMEQGKSFAIIGSSTEVDEVISLYGAGHFFNASV